MKNRPRNKSKSLCCKGGFLSTVPPYFSLDYSWDLADSMPFGRFRFSYDYGGCRAFTNAKTTLFCKLLHKTIQPQPLDYSREPDMSF